MKINPYISNYSSLYNKTSKKENLKQTNYSSLPLSCNKGISFGGLFDFLNIHKRQNYFQVDATIRTEDVKMDLNCEYQVTKDSMFEFGDEIYDLSSPYFSSQTDSLERGESFVIESDFARMTGFPDEKVLITKKDDGFLYARRLDKSEDITILKNAEELDITKNGKVLEPNVRYVLPEHSKLLLPRQIEFNPEDYDRIKYMESGERLIVGRGEDADIEIDNDYISRKHFAIEKAGLSYAVTDLGSMNGTKFKGFEGDFEDLSDISKITSLKPHKPAIIPDDCQILLGDDLAIDLRNRNINTLFDFLDYVEIGRSSDNHVVVNRFHDMVSKKHLKLVKVGNKVVAEDLGSTNGTEIIPNEKIKPFYHGAENIELKQGNVGDCYLLAPIYALSKNEKGARMLEDMVKVDDKGNYIVTFYNSDPITVKPHELDGDKVAGREEKRNVRGELGLRAIERAYGKSIKKSERLPTMYADIDDGGISGQALKTLTGLDSVTYNVRTCDVIDNLFAQLVKGGQNNHIITCGSLSSKNGEYYLDPYETIVERHAYAMGKIDLKNRKVILFNPHDTRDAFRIDFDDFKKYFARVYDAQIR